MKRAVFLLLLLCSSLLSQSLYEEGTQAYAEHNFTKAFKIFKTLCTDHIDEDAAFHIARMYERGEGVDQNDTLAQKWYATAAKRYFTVHKDEHNNIYNKQRRLFFEQLDTIDDNDTKETMQQIIESRFEFKAHNPNYFLPFAYRKDDYPSYVVSDNYTNVEAEFQFSTRFDLGSNLLGFDEIYSAAYTQRSFWQIYAESSPFRESNYMPELFVSFPLNLSDHSSFLKEMNVGLAHQSNGQGSTTQISAETLGNRSRSWNFAYVSFELQWGSAFVTLKTWKRFNENLLTDDNPDLIKYLGHGSLTVTLPYKKLVTTAMMRQNPKRGYGAFEMSISYPLPTRDDIFFYLKYFTGYGESLIDYNHAITKSSFGFSLSR